MGEQIRNCESCLYFEPPFDGVKGIGECRINPPVAVSDLKSRGFPPVKYDDWCGSWKWEDAHLWEVG